MCLHKYLKRRMCLHKYLKRRMCLHKYLKRRMCLHKYLKRRKPKTFNCLKARFKAIKTIQGNAFVINLFKTFWV